MDKKYEEANNLLKPISNVKNATFKLLYLYVLCFNGKLNEFVKEFNLCEQNIVKKNLYTYLVFIKYIKNENYIEDLENCLKVKDNNLLLKMKAIYENNFDKAESLIVNCKNEFSQLINLMCEKEIKKIKNLNYEADLVLIEELMNRLKINLEN